MDQNSVSVNSVNQEKLVYKVLLNKSWNNDSPSISRPGVYRFSLPPIRDNTNSTHYNQCVIKLDKIVIGTLSAAGAPTLNPNPVWTGGAVADNLSAVMLNISIPSPQTISCATDGAAGQQNYTNKYRELIPCSFEYTGNFQGFQPEQGAANVTGSSYSIVHQSLNDGVMCANPFGTDLEVYFTLGYDTVNPLPIYRADAGTLGTDITDLFLQFTITMIPNRSQ